MLRRCCGKKRGGRRLSLIRWLVAGKNNKTTGECQDSLEGFFFSFLHTVLGVLWAQSLVAMESF